ncbi:hypothetical protein KEM52_001071 [Ascosphaera acerosa]|nr:hypothetical protein KEM52_001071 [Ascosphaera acerosa]
MEFLTPSTTQITHSGVVGENPLSHVSAGDRYLFPVNTVLEYLPGGMTVIASFLATQRVAADGSFDDANMTGLIRPKYQRKSKKDREREREEKERQMKEKQRAEAGEGEGEGDGADKQEQDDEDSSRPQTAGSMSEPLPTSAAQVKTEGEKAQPGGASVSTDEGGAKPAVGAEPNRQEKVQTHEVYQPVTMRLVATNPRILEPLAKIVKPLAEVCRHMDDVMDRLPRADIGFLAFRLPKPGLPATDGDAAG